MGVAVHRFNRRGSDSEMGPFRALLDSCSGAPLALLGMVGLSFRLCWVLLGAVGVLLCWGAGSLGTLVLCWARRDLDDPDFSLVECLDAGQIGGLI